MNINRYQAILFWAGRDILRKPGENILLFTILTSMIFLIAVVLLTTTSLEQTTTHYLTESPTLVVTRMVAGGWVPMPIEKGIQKVQQIPGIMRVIPRIWGSAITPQQKVTIMAIPDNKEKPLFTDIPFDKLGPGMAIVGSGVMIGRGSNSLDVIASERLSVEVIHRLTPNMGIIGHNVVWLTTEDTRSVLGLEEGQATDLALYVFHDTEEQVIIPDVMEAFPWPIHITTRSDTIGRYSRSFTRRGSIFVILLLPMILSLVLVCVVVHNLEGARSCENGLLKSLGWTTGDLLLRSLSQALLLLFSSISCGLLISFWFLFWSGGHWFVSYLFGWSPSPQLLFIDTEGSIVCVIEIIAFVGVPFLVASLWSVLKQSSGEIENHLKRFI